MFAVSGPEQAALEQQADEVTGTDRGTRWRLRVYAVSS